MVGLIPNVLTLVWTFLKHIGNMEALKSEITIKKCHIRVLLLRIAQNSLNVQMTSYIAAAYTKYFLPSVASVQARGNPIGIPRLIQPSLSSRLDIFHPVCISR